MEQSGRLNEREHNEHKHCEHKLIKNTIMTSPKRTPTSQNLLFHPSASCAAGHVISWASVGPRASRCWVPVKTRRWPRLNGSSLKVLCW